MNIKLIIMSKKSGIKIVKRILYGILIVFLIGVGYGAYYINSLLPIITGYAAKNLCSAVFVSGRTQAEVEALDLNFSFIKLNKNHVDFQDSSVTSTFLWGKSKAVFREGFGATLLRGVDEKEFRKIKFPESVLKYNQDTISWPLGNLVKDTITGIDLGALKQISNNLVSQKIYGGNAFAFMVLHKGLPVAETYMKPFDLKTRFLSWSVAKSFTNTLAGIMVADGKLDINSPVELDSWANDDRKLITINDLMQMQSGLVWNEDYGNRSDVTVMLHCENDFAGFTLNKPLEAKPGSKWYYSSGTVNVLNYVMRKKFSNESDYYLFSKIRLFDKIGMPNTVFETDPSGTQVGSSYIYATARDYARYGLLYIQDGVFNGQQILPEGWVDYSISAASGSGEKYGALFWLNKSKTIPSAPEDMYWCQGHNGQRVFIIPSKELVVVVLGYSPKPDKIMNFDALLEDILAAVK